MSIDSEGDSGGAVIVNNVLAAVNSTGDSYKNANTALHNYAIDVSSANAQAVINQANVAGAAIPPPSAALPMLPPLNGPWTPPTCNE